MQEVVITGLGIVCPLGIGSEATWAAIENRQSGLRTIARLVESGFPVTFGGEVPDFDGKQYVRPRKSLKVMCRETQLAFTAAELAWADANLPEAHVADSALDAERLGIVLGANIFRSDMEELNSLYLEAKQNGAFDFGRWDSAIRQLYPLWMLKYLPNMAACHIGIAKNARGPNNTIVQGEVSALLAFIEASETIARGWADVMLTGATGSLMSWVDLVWHGAARMSRNNADPAGACRPFDAARDGFAVGEGSAVFVLESRTHAEQRGAKILGRVCGFGRRAEAVPSHATPSGKSIRAAIQAALAMARFSREDVGHVNAHGLATVEDDAAEAQAIQAELGEVPVTAPKSFMGSGNASSGAVELAISLLALQRDVIPPTLNCDHCDCPINVATTLQPTRQPSVLALNHKLTGQAVALLIGKD